MRVTLIAVGMRTKVIIILLLLLSSLVTRKVFAIYSIDISAEQSFRFMEFIDAKIWISKNASLCQVFANRVTYSKQHRS